MSSSDSDTECSDDLPSATECQNRISSFVNVTHTDDAYGQMMLQKNKWNLDLAINKHFQKEVVKYY